MGFADTYREEVVESRRARGKAARFVGRLIGFVLALAFMATLQNHPDLRQALVQAGMRGVGSVMGIEVASNNANGNASASDLAPSSTTLPRSRVPVNRAATSGSNG